MFNSYTEEFKKNAVAVVKSGMSEYKLARRLGIPASSVRNWIKNKKYSMVEPATEEMLANIPNNLPTLPQNKQSKFTGFVKISKKASHEDFSSNGIKIRIGKAQIECGKNSLVTVLKALGETGVF